MPYEFPGQHPINTGAGSNQVNRTAATTRDWLNDVVDAVARQQKALAWYLGAVTGVYAGWTNGADSLKVAAVSPTPDMRVTTKSGMALLDGVPGFLDTDSTTSAMVAPSGNPRIDIVCLDIPTQAIIVTTGSEGASPSAPSTPAGRVKLAQVYHRVGSTSIKNTDDSTNSYITDSRVYLNWA